MTKSPTGETGTEEPEEKARRSAAWVLLAIHCVAFVALLVGLVLRVRYLEAEGVRLDWTVGVLAVAGTIVFIGLVSWAVVSRRRAGLRAAVARAGLHGSTVLGYWSRMNSPSLFVGEPPVSLGRGLEVAVTADSEGVRIRTLVHHELVDFGLIPWWAVETIDSAPKKVGVGFWAKSGVLRIGLSGPVPPYAEHIEVFPIQQAADDALKLLTKAIPV